MITVCLDDFVIDRDCHLFPLDVLQFLEIYKIVFPQIFPTIKHVDVVMLNLYQ